MKRRPPAPKYVTRCLWCGGLIGNGITSWTTWNKTQIHDDECPAADSIRAGLLPTNASTREDAR